ncbi:DNA adenine methylase [Lysinibacillus varians]|uniref:site-specific DNA-methyltransferase (adenine-specific) n=1 Tax=Lysinibacillus varians TaxID=1145276 RepID=A0ABY2TG69_9BACI|nr:DNA adenine methylase [Lysinibacillus varians]AHN23388.1 DNA methyltransferase [Lysinibacillus varians]TKI67044.1 DNA adenine methylase [Lysinibacillus varians]
MPYTKSPLRYPGGKTQLHKFVSHNMELNGVVEGVYCEPFAGGAGVAIELLLTQKVERVILNDLNNGIYSIWYSILNDIEKFIDKIEEIEITIDEWLVQKKIYSELINSGYSIDLAFATFFLNRTCRSGIITGGPIGNMEQTAKDKIDARFNKKTLIKKIREINRKRDCIDLYNLDANALIDEVIIHEDPSKLFIFFDPPYYKQGKNLYTNFFQHNDHVLLSEKIRKLNNYNWIVTYDFESAIKDIYSGYPIRSYDLNYSVTKKRKEKEYLIFNPNLNIESYDKVELNNL